MGNGKEDNKLRYPVGGPREPVYALMRKLGFTESNWSDKHWYGPDKFEVQIYGTGSMARITLPDDSQVECPLEELAERLNTIRIKSTVEPVVFDPHPGELLPCPFCGSEAGLEHDESYSGGVWRVYCIDDGDDGCPIGRASTIGYARRIEAAAAWNKRLAR